MEAEQPNQTADSMVVVESLAYQRTSKTDHPVITALRKLHKPVSFLLCLAIIDKMDNKAHHSLV